MDYVSPNSIIAKLGSILREPIPNDLTEHIKNIESKLFELVEAKVETHRFLQEKRNQMLHPKDKDLTELDRTTMLNSSVAVIQRDYDFLCEVHSLALRRLDICTLLLTD